MLHGIDHLTIVTDDLKKAGKSFAGAGFRLTQRPDAPGYPTEKLLIFFGVGGTVLTMAGHKGYALALMVEAFSGVLAGAAVGSAIGSMYKNMDRPQNVGHFFCLFDVSAFMPPAEFGSGMGRMIDEIKGSRKRPGVTEILVPGERSTRVTRDNAAHGVPVAKAVLDELNLLCTELGIPADLVPADQ